MALQKNNHPTPRKQDTSWGGVAEWYNELVEERADSYQASVILPNLLRVLNVQKGERIIDIGCGQGYFSRAVYEQGASVTGTDVSQELIALAKAQSPLAIRYEVAHAQKLSFAKQGEYDAAIIVLALQNMENLDAVCAELARVLKTRGRAVLVLNHPTFRVLKHSHWGYDEKEDTQYRRIDRYLSSEKIVVDMHPGTRGGAKTVSYHRSLQDYGKAFHKHGLVITRIEEWISHKTSEKGPRQKAENRARKEIPLFMMLELSIR